jgi:polyferredoxin
MDEAQVNDPGADDRGTRGPSPATTVSGGAGGARRRAGGWRAARGARRAVQIVCFAGFVYLLFAALQRHEAHPFADLFFRFDPLAAFGTMLAARAWLPDLGLALVTVALTIVLGRVWCGWICPLGTLLGWLRFGSARRAAKRLPRRLRSVKYMILVALAVMAAFGSMTLMVLDPLSLLTRTATTSLVPAFAYAVTGLERLAVRWTALEPAVTWIDDTFRGNLLPQVQPRFGQAIAIFLVFLTVVLLNALADRFWCRYLCPLGALLGWLSKVQVFRPLVGDACTHCGQCRAACRVDAIETPAAAAPAGAAGERVVSSECTMCLDCLVACPEPGALRFGAAMRPGPARPGPFPPYDPGRRQFVAAAGAGVGAVLLLATGVWRTRESPALLRPPGVTTESTFLSLCLRCSECMKVCPTSGLQPALDEAGLEGLWTPVLRPRLGPCDYSCTACGHTCPSGAIPKLGLEEKRTQVIGIAVIDRDRCLPWAQGTPCIVCQEMCPTPQKAITLDKGRYVTNAQGGRDWVKRPSVIPRLCIGCGICELKCPVSGASAIVVERHASSLALPGSATG